MIRLFILCFFLFSSSVMAKDIDIIDLENQNRVGISIEIDNQQPIAVNEQITVFIDVFTDRWFTKGTRVYLPQIKDAIVLQPNKLATNGTMRKNRKTYATQRWELTIYPQKQGEFIIPAIPVNITVSENSNYSVNGTLFTKPLKFNSTIVNHNMNDNTNWLSATSFKVKQNLSKNKELKIGDAITREISFEAEGTVSMMLPILDLENVDKVKSYTSSSQNSDSHTRGEYKATKNQKVVYIVQEEGEIKIPDIEFYWWDYKNDKMNKITIEGDEFLSQHTFKSWIKTYSIHIFVFFVFVLILFINKNRIKNATLSVWHSNSVSFYRALLLNDFSKANQFNYQKLNEISNKKSFQDIKEIKVNLENWNLTYKDKKTHKKLELYKIRKMINSIKKENNKNDKRILKF